MLYELSYSNFMVVIDNSIKFLAWISSPLWVLFGDLIVTEDEAHVFILFCEKYYTLSSAKYAYIIWFFEFKINFVIKTDL